MGCNILTSKNTVILQCNITEKWFTNNLNYWIKLLNDVDLARYRAIKSQRKKCQLLLGRVLIYHGIACLKGIIISSYHIEKYSKLTIANSDTSYFLSIAHCQNYVLLVLTNSEIKIGIDIERASNRDFKELSKEFFNSREVSQLAESNFSNEVFYRLWTAKEALTKAVSGVLSSYLSIDCSNVLAAKQAILHVNKQPFHYYYWEFDSYICALVCEQPIDDLESLYTVITHNLLVRLKK